MISTMPKAPKSSQTTVETLPEVTLVEPELKTFVADSLDLANEELPTGPRFGEFKDLEGRAHKIELVDLGTKFSAPGGRSSAPLEDYFFTEDGASPYNFVSKQRMKQFGYPVTSDTLLSIFNDKFKPEDGFLLYKEELQDVYIIVVPKKFTKMSRVNGNVSGDIQIHALSFMGLGSVNIELFKSGLDNIAKNIGYTK
jgi:hypothetical protein